MRTIFSMAGVGGALALLSAVTLAAAEPQGETQRRDALREHRAMRPVLEGRTSGQDHSFRMSEVLNLPVQGDNNQHLGQIKELLVNLTQDRAHQVLVMPDKGLGMRDNLIPIPWEAVAIENQQGKRFAMVHITADHLKQAPNFARDRWPDFTHADWSTAVDKFFALTGGDRNLTHNDVKDMIFPATNLLGKVELKDRNREDVGRIQDVVFDSLSGHFRYAVSDLSKVPGMENKLVSIPYQVLRLFEKTDNPSEKYYAINLDRDHLKQAPSFTRDSWPNFDDRNADRDVDRFYGVGQERSTWRQRLFHR